LREAQREAAGFAQRTYNATLGADKTGFSAAINEAEREGEAFARQNYDASIGARGAAETAAEIKGVDTAADRLDGRDVTVDINADEAGLRRIGDGFRALASNIRATGTVLRAASIPFLIAGIGAGIPTVAALAASVSGLGVALGSGLVGGAVAATGALGALAGAFGLVAIPVSMLLTNLKDYDDSLDAVAGAETAARSAAQSRAAALQTLSDAQANVAATARESRQAVADQEEALRRTRADAATSIADAERNLAEARASGAEGVREAELGLASARRDASRAIAEAERTLATTRASAAQANAGAEQELESARDSLASSTRSLSSAQDELNRALREEPLTQAQATLDLAFARDRAGDALRSYNEAVAEFGTNSEEASDARRDLQQANLDLQRTENEVRDTRRLGSEELRGAQEAARAAGDEQRAAAEAVRDSEQAVVDTRAEGVAQIREQQRALRETRGDASAGIAEQERALAQARAERIAGEREAAREVVTVRRDAALEIADAEETLADTSREGALRVAEAQAAVADAQRAAASAAEDAAAAQRKVRDETERLTPAQTALFDEYQRFGKQADRAFRPAQDAAATLGVAVLTLAESYLPRLGRASEDTIGALSRSFATFRAELAQPVEQAGITRFLEVIPDLTQAAATAAGRLGLALVNVFSRSLKFALPLTHAIGDLALEFLRWTETVRGARAIDAFFQRSVNMGLRLLPIIGDLGTGFLNIVSALQRTGIVDQSVRGFGALADAFARGTQAGGRFDAFLRSVRELMPFVADAAKAIGGAILGIADAAIGATADGAKLTVLQQIFRGIQAAARPLEQLVVGTFRALGPAIADLLPALSQFFATFAGSSGPLVAFVNTLTRALQVFNQLPAPIRNTIATLTALKLILGTLGISAVIAPLGRFAAGLVATRGAGSGLVGILASIGRFLLGPWGIAIAAAVAGIVLVVRNFDAIKRAAQPVINVFGSILNALRPVIGQLGGALLGALQAFGRGVAAAIAPGKGFKGIIESIAAAISGFAKNALPAVLGALRSVTNWIENNQGVFRLLGRIVGTVLVVAFNGAVTTFKAMVGTVQLLWRAIQPAIGAIRALINLGKRAGEALLGLYADVKKAIEDFTWADLGKFIINRILDGLEQVPIFGPLIKKIRDSADKVKNEPLGFTGIGEQMMEGIKKGMEAVPIYGPLISKIDDAKNRAREFIEPGSPSELFAREVGRPIGEGVAKGMDDAGPAIEQAAKRMTDRARAGVGDISGSEALRTAGASARGRQAISAAQRASSAGGKNITAAEMRAIMREAHAAQGKNIYAAAVAAGLDPRALRLLDSMVAKDFNFRTNMLADAR
jgi:hypothetical protein